MSRSSKESGLPVAQDVPYQHVDHQNSPYGTTALANESAVYGQRKSGTSKWLKIAVPVIVLLIIGGIAAGVVVSKKHKDNASSSSSGPTNPSAAASIKNALGRFPTATNSFHQPIYPSAVSPNAILLSFT